MRGVWSMVAACALLASGSVASAPPTAAAASASQGGALWLRPNHDLFDRMALRASNYPKRGELWQIQLEPRVPVGVLLGDGAPTALVSGALAAPGLQLVRASDSAKAPALRIVPDPTRHLGWSFVDADGGVWLRIAHGMRSPDTSRDGLRLITADLRVGPRLAAWTSLPESEDRLLANAALKLPLARSKSGGAVQQPKTCAAPNFPGTPGYVTDVVLVDMDRVDVLRCRTDGLSGCDGPGGDDAEVVIVPSATLRNHLGADAADVPWYNKFTGIFPPYGNDQHPYLVWSMYRIDAQGRIEQIGRSGLKHAFATANELCQDATCQTNGNILGRACQDLYNAGSNDLNFLLSPRAELIPSSGIWGRCGSVFDDVDNNPSDGLAGCDGQQDNPPPDDGYRERLVLRESDIDAAANPGASYLIDAWYVVRDDRDIYNTMGYRSLQPQYSGAFWNEGPLGPFTVGAVIDGWLAASPAGAFRHRGVAATVDGDIGVAARVTALVDGRYQYDYALMNFDFSRAAIDPGSAEPNLRIWANAGLTALELQIRNGASVDESTWLDGDDSVSNDWATSTVSNALRVSGDDSSMFEWGQLRFLRVISDAAPAPGEIRFEVGVAGLEADHATVTLVPDASQLFRSSFE